MTFLAALLWTVVSILLMFASLAPTAEAQNLRRASARITSATTTTLAAAVAGTSMQIFDGSVCVDSGGVATTVTLQDTGGTNLVGSNIVYQLAPGTCLWMNYKGTPYFRATTSGTGLAIVTGAAGPVNVYLEYVQ